MLTLIFKFHFIMANFNSTFGSFRTLFLGLSVELHVDVSGRLGKLARPTMLHLGYGDCEPVECMLYV